MPAIGSTHMPSFWDTPPVSAWPTQPFIPPIDPTQVFAPRAPSDWLASPGRAPAPVQAAAPASGDADAGKSADASATLSNDSSGESSANTLRRFTPRSPQAARAAAEASRLPSELTPLGLTGALATASLLATTTRTAEPEDDEFHPQYVVRGGPSSPPFCSVIRTSRPVPACRGACSRARRRRGLWAQCGLRSVMLGEAAQQIRSAGRDRAIGGRDRATGIARPGREPSPLSRHIRRRVAATQPAACVSRAKRKTPARPRRLGSR